jgi:hypothetical protein
MRYENEERLKWFFSFGHSKSSFSLEEKAGMR